MDNVGRSKLKLILFALLVLSMFAAMMVTGWLRRDKIRELGGPVIVDVLNSSPERYRTDVYVGSQFATLELDGGEEGRLRFAPRDPQPLRVVLVQKTEILRTEEFGIFTRDAPRRIQVIIAEDGLLQFEEKSEESGS